MMLYKIMNLFLFLTLFSMCLNANANCKTFCETDAVRSFLASGTKVRYKKEDVLIDSCRKNPSLILKPINVGTIPNPQFPQIFMNASWEYEDFSPSCVPVEGSQQFISIYSDWITISDTISMTILIPEYLQIEEKIQ